MITIITPVLNASKYIQFNIESVQGLNISFEHIIVDGGSTDGTLDILKKYPHLIILNQDEKTGMYGAIHQGIEISKGNYICWINADDYVIPKGFETMYNVSMKGDYGLIYSNGIYHYIEEYEYKKIFVKSFTRYLLKEGLFALIQPSTVFSKEAYYKTGGFNYRRLKLIADRDLFQRMAYDNSIKFKLVGIGLADK